MTKHMPSLSNISFFHSVHSNTKTAVLGLFTWDSIFKNLSFAEQKRCLSVDGKMRFHLALVHFLIIVMYIFLHGRATEKNVTTLCIDAKKSSPVL